MSYYDQVKEAADAIRARVAEIPAIGIVLGSGLGDFAGSLGEAVTVRYGELPHWPASRISSCSRRRRRARRSRANINTRRARFLAVARPIASCHA